MLPHLFLFGERFLRWKKKWLMPSRPSPIPSFERGSHHVIRREQRPHGWPDTSNRFPGHSSSGPRSSPAGQEGSTGRGSRQRRPGQRLLSWDSALAMSAVKYPYAIPGRRTSLSPFREDSGAQDGFSLCPPWPPLGSGGFSQTGPELELEPDLGPPGGAHLPVPFCLL